MLKYLPLVLAGLWRKPVRTILTFLSIVVAFILFGIMASIESGFDRQVDAARLDRLYVDARYGGPLPMAYMSRIQAVPGVRAVIPTSGVGGYWKDRRNGIGINATTEDYVVARPEYTIDRALLQRMEKSRTGIIVSKAIARRHNWKVGDRIPLTSQVAQQNGSTIWNFDIIAIADNRDMPDTAQFILGSYKYIDEARTTDRGTANRFLVRIPDEKQAVAVGRAIDRLFENSPKPTRTFSEKSSAQAGTSNLGSISFFTRGLIGAVLFMLLFLTGNTMMQSMRERTSEFAVLKTIGFSDRGVLALVFGEAVILCVTAGLIGLAFVKLVVPLLARGLPGNTADLLLMPWSAAATGLVFALLTAFISSFFPAVRVSRMKLVDALAGR
jgi:putative ABC transport system permease protein